jgi:hypothetical protein
MKPDNELEQLALPRTLPVAVSAAPGPAARD